MEHLSDRRRVERALVPGMLLTVALEIQNHPQMSPGALSHIIASLNEAVAETADDIEDQDRRRKLAQRCRRLTSRAWEAAEFWETDKRKGATVGKVWLAVTFWIADLFDRGVMVTGNCPFTQAFEDLREAMMVHEETLAVMERSAARSAERLRQFFEREGYFIVADGRPSAPIRMEENGHDGR